MSLNVTWHHSGISMTERILLNQHRSFCLWLTGLSGAGKSTLATALERSFHQLGIRTYILDGDNLRHGLNADLGFAPEDRKENVRRAAYVARLFVDAGMVVIVSMISPFREDRELARGLFPPELFYEVYVDCPVDVCSKRDPKGLYRLAETGRIQNFTGITSPYEVPSHPDIHVKTAEYDVPSCVDYVHDLLFNNADVSK